MPAPLIVLGGTFDPPHLAHLVLADSALDQLGGRVLFIPAGDPWRKAERHITPASHRVAMTRLAIEGHEAFSLDLREVQREGPSYTVDTLEELHREGYTRIVLVLGSDALADLPNWKDPERIRQLATLAVAARDDGEQPQLDPGVIPIAMPCLQISSTMIRERVRARRTIRYLVPDPVREYIEQHALYR